MTKKREIATIIIIIISNIRLLINKENIYVRHKQKEIHKVNIVKINKINISNK